TKNRLKSVVLWTVMSLSLLFNLLQGIEISSLKKKMQSLSLSDNHPYRIGTRMNRGLLRNSKKKGNYNNRFQSRKYRIIVRD
ncbi:MAG: hypothetical protein ACK5DE_00050, partial [Bacteroidota bacterium]